MFTIWPDNVQTGQRKYGMLNAEPQPWRISARKPWEATCAWWSVSWARSITGVTASALPVSASSSAPASSSSPSLSYSGSRAVRGRESARPGEPPRTASEWRRHVSTTALSLLITPPKLLALRDVGLTFRFKTGISDFSFADYHPDRDEQILWSPTSKRVTWTDFLY